MTITRTKLLLVLLAGLAVGGSVYYFSASGNEGIYPYNPSTDRAPILQIFKDEWYWLISDVNSKVYSAENMLDKRTPGAYSPYAGKLIIETYHVAGKTAGFIAYYPKELYEATILFVAVGKEYRSKGYARKMVLHALDELKKKGFLIVRLNTRVDNKAGRTLYTKLGFKEIENDGAYVQYEKSLS